MTGAEEIRIHRAQRRQATLNRLREAAEHPESARKLLAQVDPSGDLRYWPPAEDGEQMRQEVDGG